jgi:hypothetical protein
VALSIARNDGEKSVLGFPNSSARIVGDQAAGPRLPKARRPEKAVNGTGRVYSGSGKLPAALVHPKKQ